MSVTQSNRSQGQWQGPYRDSVVVPEGSPRYRGPTYKCPSSNFKPLKFSRTLHSADTVWQCAWIAMKKIRNFSYESDRRRDLLICTNCLRKCFVIQLHHHLWNAHSAQVDIHAATPCTRGQQVIKWTGDGKSSIKPQLVYYCVECKTHVSLTVTTFTVYWQWWCSTSTYYQCLVEINVVNYMLLHFKSTEVFEIRVLVHCPRGVSPSLIAILPRDGQCSMWLTKWRAACAMFCEWLYYVRAVARRVLGGAPTSFGSTGTEVIA